MMEWRSGVETAAQVGEACAAFRSLHGVLGKSASSSMIPAVTVALDERALEHAWHAEILFERLPHRDGVDREALVRPGTLGPLIDLLEGVGADHDALEVLAVYAASLSTLTASVSSLRTHASPAAERALQRACRFIEFDLEDAQTRSSEVLSALTADIDLAERVTAATQDCEMVLGRLGSIEH
jgi:hypothetical protein